MWSLAIRQVVSAGRFSCAEMQARLQPEIFGPISEMKDLPEICGLSRQVVLSCQGSKKKTGLSLEPLFHIALDVWVYMHYGDV